MRKKALYVRESSPEAGDGVNDDSQVRTSGFAEEKNQFELSKAGKEALDRLRLSRDAGQNTQRKFEELVVSNLAFISASRAVGGKKAKADNAVQRQRRIAGRCRKFGDYLVNNPPSVGLALGSLRSFLLAGDLMRYAEELEALADTHAAQRRKPPRHRVHQLNRELIDLLAFVRQLTGRSHWKEMEVLLQEATSEKGLTGRRLAALWHDHQRRPR